MRASHLSQALSHLIAIQRPAFIWGPPGIGKSDVVAALAESQKLQLTDVRLSLLDSVDLKGFPVADMKTRQMSWLPADFLPTTGKGILFLDEMNSAPPTVQAASYQLILNRRIGDYKLPDGWSIIAAGNRESDRSVVNRMPAALANRMIHLEMEAHLDDWCTWALNNGINSDTIAFLRFKPDLLNFFKPEDKANPTPRTWAFVDSIMKNQTLDPVVARELIKGTVGEGPGGEFIAFIKTAKELPTFEEIMKAPTKIDIPKAVDVLFALTTSLAMKSDTTNFDTLMSFINRIPTEFQVVFVRDAARRNNAIAKCKAFTAWTTANSAVIM